MFIHNLRSKTGAVSKAGFTLIELMVTVTIVVLVTGIIMVQYSSFNSSVLLTSQAYRVAFDFRETQSLAISVKGDGGDFQSAYGLFMDLAATDPNQFVLFKDDITYGVADPIEYSVGEEIGTPYKLDARFRLDNICATNAAGTTCFKDDPTITGETVDSNLHTMTVSFVRPNFDAEFYTPIVSNILSIELSIGTNDNSKIKKVKLYTTGQISVE